MKVLLLCDREELRRGYKAALKLYGYDVFTSANVGDTYGAAICDIGDDTEQVLKELKKILYDRVVMLVSPAWDGGGLPVGTAAVLRKPVTAQKLLSALNMRVFS